MSSEDSHKKTSGFRRSLPVCGTKLERDCDQAKGAVIVQRLTCNELIIHLTLGSKFVSFCHSGLPCSMQLLVAILMW